MTPDVLADNPPFLPVEAATRYIKSRYGVCYSTKYFARMRSTGGGPDFTKFGGRITYAPRDLDAWMTKRSSGRVNRTSERSSVRNSGTEEALDFMK